VLRFDRYLVRERRVIDLATGRAVAFTCGGAEPAVALFGSADGRTLIDLDTTSGARVEVWERWSPPARRLRAPVEIVDFIEMLDCARLGAPRAFDLDSRRPAQREYLRRVLAREARVRGWVPIAAELLGAIARRSRTLPSWIGDRSMVIFADPSALSADARAALRQVAQRSVRPHILVRTLATKPMPDDWPAPETPRESVALRESSEPLATGAADEAPPDLTCEAEARWRVLLDVTRHGRPDATQALALATVLAGRGQVFEACAIATAVHAEDTATAARVQAVIDSLAVRAAARAATALRRESAGPDRGKGWDMVDDFVGVLQICQDVEDEQMALARVGAYLRDRLQASSVAFVAREGAHPVVLARVGSEAAAMDAAVRSMETGVPIAPARGEGPVDSACPVRHATQIIGAIWCRWSAGVPVASPQATSLLGIAAAAAAPSMRLALARTTSAAAGASAVPELVGGSAAMTAVRGAIVRAASSPFPVLIEGESGSGKELAARAIHARSARRDRRFCAINCAALVDELAEAELFGHVRGAFTGATSDRPGMFEDAHGGTLFLDEVVELGPRVQAKLLRALQEGEIRRVGETLVRKVDVRVVAATNRPLAREVDAGRFRADLWYRLDVIRIALPPLRERLEDLPMLTAHLWQGLAARTGSRAVLSSAALGALAAYDWPGNIRELQNVLASMLVATPRGGLIGPSTLPAHVARVAVLERAATLAHARRQFEARYVKAALARAGGRTAAAARELGLSRQGLAKLISRLGLADARQQASTDGNVQ
jgi:DNA-binding NtrC family response regulator